jgi:outer membrane protein OmpA-like peptidoglycan-associated protein
MDSMQRRAADDSIANKAAADVSAKKATADSLALILAASNLAEEKSKRTDAENKLLSTGELLLDAVYFETGKTIISINSKPYLNIIGKMLAKYPKLQIEVQGHTDNVGGQAYNVTLSQGRADAVRSYLVDVSPALNSTLSAHGYGMSMAKADNATKEGRLINRRVELRVTNKDALLQYNGM